MGIISNLRGTSEEHFRFDLTGPTIYTGTDDPNVIGPLPIDTLNSGDFYLQSGGSPWTYDGVVWHELGYVANNPTFSISHTDLSTTTTNIDIGTIPVGYTVKSITIDVVTAFNGSQVDDITISNNGNTILDAEDTDILQEGIYKVERAIEPMSGSMLLSFGGTNSFAITQGELAITVDLIKI